MTNDSIHTYTFDAENRVKAVDATAASYTYSGPMRIKKVQGATNTVYIFSGSKVIAEYVNGALSREYIYLGNQLLYTVRYGAVDTYHHFDHLSTRIETRTDGTAERGYAHFPFGETWYESGPDVPGAQKYKFTSYERDQESGLDQAVFRYYSPRIGRFMSADLLSGDISDPQTLNRYAYVLNDPVGLIDPLGLQHDSKFLQRRCYFDVIYRLEEIEGGDRQWFTYTVEVCNWVDLSPIPAPDGGGGGDRSPTFTDNRQERYEQCLQKKKTETDRARERFAKDQGERVLQRMGRGALVGGAKGVRGGTILGTELGLTPVGGAIVGGVVGAVAGAGGAAINTIVIEPLAQWRYDRFTYQPVLDRAFIECAAEANTTPPGVPK